VSVLGLGIGGWIAAEMAVRCTHHIKRLGLVDAVGIKVSGPTKRDIADTFIIPPQEFLGLAWHDPELGAQRMKLPGVSALHTGGTQAAVAGTAASLTESELVALLRNRQSAALFTWKPFMHNPKLRARLRRVDVPSLVLWGESDRIVSPEYGRAYAQAIPGARFQTLPAAGHYPYLEQPDAFVEAVETFLFSDSPPTAGAERRVAASPHRRGEDSSPLPLGEGQGEGNRAGTVFQGEGVSGPGASPQGEGVPGGRRSAVGGPHPGGRRS
jgi:pimeloyl-ACP methyl ester carboxylesterase